VSTLLFPSLVFHSLRSNFVRARAADHIVGGCGAENAYGFFAPRAPLKKKPASRRRREHSEALPIL
jgi:hypothetical protein